LTYSQNEADSIFKKSSVSEGFLEEFEVDRIIGINEIPQSEGDLSHDYYNMSECNFENFSFDLHENLIKR
jgi:hypothetical protein